MTRSPDVLLITKTSTQNQGNQALSQAWLSLLRESFPAHNVAALERMPAYLKRFQTAQLRAESDVIAEFDSWARELARLPAQTPKPSTTQIRHVPGITQATRFMGVRKYLAPRARLARMGYGRTDYASRVSAIRAARLLIINPAGEFQVDASDTALAYLLEMRVGQLVGARTAMVNLSLEVRHPAVRAITAHVLNQADLVEFRDSASAREFSSMGGVVDALVLPDAAVLTRTQPTGTHRDGNPNRKVALAINGLQAKSAGLNRDWTELIEKLQAAAIQPVLVSNEWSTDEPFWRALVERHGLESEGRDLDYLGYASLLGEFDVVLSSRLHTCVLALCSGTRVVPVETGTFKLSGFFDQIGLAGTPIALGTPGWIQEATDRLTQMPADAATERSRQMAAREAGREKLRAALVPALQELLMA